MKLYSYLSFLRKSLYTSLQFFMFILEILFLIQYCFTFNKLFMFSLFKVNCTTQIILDLLAGTPTQMDK